MFARYYWGCTRPRWAYAGPQSPQKSRSTCYESRRSGHGLFGHSSVFGVRRPLRFMSDRLDLDDDQLRQLAEMLARLKTERAQAVVDWERSVAELADSLDGDTFDTGKAEEALRTRLESGERLRNEILDTLSKTHAMLNAEQRAELSYLLRSGQLSI